MTRRLEPIRKLPKLSRRHAVQGLLAAGSGACMAGLALQAPAWAVAATPSATRPISTFGDDDGALQRALDWAHETRGTLVLDRNIVVRHTMFMGHLRLIDGGGRLTVMADRAYRIRGDAGDWGSWGAILMRSAPGNPTYGEPIETQYLVQVNPGCRMDFVRSDPTKPRYPIRFTGLAEGSYVYLDFTARGLIDDECNGPDWYVFNRCRIGGSYLLEFANEIPTGGFWMRDVDEFGLGPGRGSDFDFDWPTFAKIGGRAECASIFNTDIAPGYVRARGSLTISQSSGIGFSILNFAHVPPQQFDVALDEVRILAKIRDGQAVVKIIDDHSSIRLLEATVTGVTRGLQKAAVLQCITRGETGSMPTIGEARLTSAGGTSLGYQGVRAVLGRCAIANPRISRLRKDA